MLCLDVCSGLHEWHVNSEAGQLPGVFPEVIEGEHPINGRRWRGLVLDGDRIDGDAGEPGLGAVLKGHMAPEAGFDFGSENGIEHLLGDLVC